MLMERKGRLLGFRLGAVMLIISGVLGYIAVSLSNYYLLIASHAFLGAYVACANFYRFATVDNINVNLKSKAMSCVIAGGLAAAVLGPLVSIFLRDISEFVEFSLCYAFFCILGVLTLVILNNKVVRNFGDANSRVAEKEKRETFQKSMSINTAVLSIAVLSASTGYFIMNLLMIQSSLVMKDLHSFNHSSFAIQAHIFSMFFPSLFFGILIKKMGALKVIMIGYVLLMACSLIAVLYPPNYNWMFIGLILLGLGWNFTYVGGGALLAEKATENQRFAWQGVNVR